MIERRIQQAATDMPPALDGYDHINRYWDPTNDTYVAKIQPGQYYVTTAGESIVTVLGSCVSACVRDRVFGIGGMNHFMLPRGQDDGDSLRPGDVSNAARYGNFAMEHLINEVLKHGGSRRNLEVKIFGGGRILSQMTDIGRRNIRFVREYLETEGLLVVAEDVGDICPRKVMYFPRSGRARVKKLRALHNNTIVQREVDYMRSIETAPVEGEVVLF